MSPIFTATHCPRGMRTGRIGIGGRVGPRTLVDGILAAHDPACEHAPIIVEYLFEFQLCPVLFPVFLCSP